MLKGKKSKVGDKEMGKEEGEVRKGSQGRKEEVFL